MDTLQPDDLSELGSYRLLRRLGAGGMGRVYLARSPGGRTVAVKVVRNDLAADPDFRARFRHEVAIARAVSGRFTAPVVDADPEAALPWLATAYVLGPDLTDVVEAHGALPERTVRALAAGLAAALRDIHAAGLVHRDLKPSNVLLAADGPRVIDFGIARAVDGARMTQTGLVVGSPGFMSPEQATGADVGTAGDVFSLGTVLAFAATGRSAFGDAGSSHAALLYQIVHGEPDLTAVPASLAGLVRACLLKDPARRPAPAEILAALAPHGIDAALHDWLPSTVASTIARHAAGVLDMEAPEALRTAERQAGTGFGPAPTMPAGAPSPAYGTPVPGPTAPGAPAAAPSRRRALGLVLGGAAAVAVAGGGAAWWLAGPHDDSGSTSGSASGGGEAEPAGETFSTPPAGVAPQPLWHTSVTEDSTSAGVPLLTHDGLLLISGDPLVAYDVRTGKARWTKPGVCRAGAPLLFHDGKVFLADGDHDGVLVAYDVGTGEEVWRSRLGKGLAVQDTIAIDDKHVYVTATDYSDSRSATDYRTAVAAVGHGTGRTAWVQYRDWGTRDYDVQGTAAGRYLAYADSNKNLTVRDTATGAQLWTRKLGEEWSWQPTVADGLVFLPGEQLTAVDADKGGTVWTLSPAGRRGFGNPTVTDGVLYVGDHDNGVWAVDVKTGRRSWLCDELDDDGPQTFLRAGTTLYGASGPLGGGIVALEARTGKVRWAYDDRGAEGEPWQLARSGNRLLATHGTEIYALPAV
ncbi:PQQ-binding-like beta-propeller repeat protein [Streptomyces sp. NPDC003717]|uniref:protein kinase domain-containing protein n=1 Tax=Streptomyces sp. NPDC003717 TaxID=3154276 RepID=UPI0033A351A3